MQTQEHPLHWNSSLAYDSNSSPFETRTVGFPFITRNTTVQLTLPESFYNPRLPLPHRTKPHLPHYRTPFLPLVQQVPQNPLLPRTRLNHV